MTSPTMPNQKTGIECPTRATTRAILSMKLSRNKAATRPSGTPTNVEMITASVASSNVAGNAWARSEETGLPVSTAVPKSPCASPFR
ncbi:hypothetical protein ACVI1T_001232 [Rhizobium redzepovicii]